MEINKNILESLEGKTDDEQRELLIKIFRLDIDKLQQEDGPCKTWYAQVFNYCNANELQEDLDIFFYLVNLLGYLFDICFNQEDTVFLGCICPCGTKQTILYYSLTYGD